MNTVERGERERDGVCVCTCTSTETHAIFMGSIPGCSYNIFNSLWCDNAIGSIYSLRKLSVHSMPDILPVSIEDSKMENAKSCHYLEEEHILIHQEQYLTNNLIYFV